VGYNEGGRIIDSYADSSVSGSNFVGGLVGRNRGQQVSEGNIINCYSSGTVDGNDYVGGLVGFDNYYKHSGVTQSYWDIETSGQTTSDGGMGKTTAQMQTLITFMAWACHSVWTIDESVDYPRLLWENMPGEPITIPSYGGGSGEPNDPYLIYTAEHLNTIGSMECIRDKHFKLMADIDLGGLDGQDGRPKFNIIGTDGYNPFSGVFDGNGHTISNFIYDSGDRLCGGLFGYVDGANPEIKNLGLIDPNVDAGTGNYVGSLVGFINGTITNCYVEGGSVSGDEDVGGLVGYNQYGTITDCYSTGNVTGVENVGGLVGLNHGTITNCYSAGSVSGSHRVGGLLGGNDRWTITYCYATGSISGEDDVGGLVGWNYKGTIINCYSAGSVTGNNRVGGLVGLNEGGYRAFSTIRNCYSTGTVSGMSSVGGLVGGKSYGEVTASFWDTQTSEQSASAGGTGKTTAQMQDPSTFMDVGWDFVGKPDGPHDVWAEPAGGGYPILCWQLLPFFGLPGFSGGSGTNDDPYLISTANGLNSIGHNPRLMEAHFKLINDIDLSSIDFFIIGNRPSPFNGIFDGNGHTVSNFSYTSPNADRIGLFGDVSGQNAKIKNLGLIDPNVDADSREYVGSLVGRLYKGTITNCYAEGGSVAGGWSVGGLVGFNSGTITNCYATGSVSGNSFVGGLVGYINNGTITNCYSVGSVPGDWRVGGLVGYNYKGATTNSFWDTETSGQTTSAGGWGKTTAAMQTESTFRYWDFVGETFNGIEDIWFIPQQDYPHLWWEGMQFPMKLTPRTLNCRSQGNWVKAHLTLPQGFTVADVDPNRPAVLHSFGFQSLPLYVFVNENELVEIKAAFEREALCSLTGNWPQKLTVAGFLTDGNIFLGSSTVRMITPGTKDIGELSLYWLNADCVQPDFCDGIDLNRDSLVNFLDYALLQNSQVEFVSE
jgi:hypothetical protein